MGVAHRNFAVFFCSPGPASLPDWSATERVRGAPPPPLPSRTKWTRLVHPSVLIGHVSSTCFRTLPAAVAHLMLVLGRLVRGGHAAVFVREGHLWGVDRPVRRARVPVLLLRRSRDPPPRSKQLSATGPTAEERKGEGGVRLICTGGGDVHPVCAGRGRDVRPVCAGRGRDVRPVCTEEGWDVHPVCAGRGRDVRPICTGRGRDVRPICTGRGRGEGWRGTASKRSRAGLRAAARVEERLAARASSCSARARRVSGL